MKKKQGPRLRSRPQPRRKSKRYSRAFGELNDDGLRYTSLRCIYCHAGCNDDLLEAQRVG